MKSIKRTLLNAGLIAGMLTSINACAAEQAAEKDPLAEHKAEMKAGSTDLAGQVAAGEQLYQTYCAACHQPNGEGLAGAFPPLADSDYLMADKTRAINTVIGGLSGEITVNGKTYNAVMPNMSYMKDEEVANVITYVMNSWGNKGYQVSTAEVMAARSGEAAVEPAAAADHPVTGQSEAAYKGTKSAIDPEMTAQMIDSDGPEMTKDQFAFATKIYFERCAGCHGFCAKAPQANL